MKTLALMLFASLAAWGQASDPSILVFGAPPGGVGGACTPGTPFAYLTSVGQLVTCVSSTWTAVSGGGGGSGTVTSVATTLPIAGGTITGAGTISCPTCGVTGTSLAQFAATTSAQLAGVISDETGTGALVFATAPTLIGLNVTGVIAATSDIHAGASSNIYWTGRSTMHSSANGIVTLTNNAATGLTRLNLGCDTASCGGFSVSGTTTASELADGSAQAPFSASVYDTETNCSSSSSPAVCAKAAGGSFTVAAGATTIVVNTSAVTANSQILVTFDSSLGTKLGVTCNATVPALFGVTARSAATSFTLTSTSPITNPACFSFLVVN